MRLEGERRASLGPVTVPRSSLPSLPGVLSVDDVAATATSIASMQEPDGAIPWTTGSHTDVWNHIEAAMGLLVAGRPDEAHLAYEWVLGTQRADGTWPLQVVEGVVTDEGAETNMAAYLAVGVWHHWLVRRDEPFVRRCWPALSRGLDWVVSLQQEWGGVPWAVDAQGRVQEDCLLAGGASIHHALRAGLAVASLMDQPRPAWERAAGRLGHALRRHRAEFADRSTFSMDWYYPVLGGAVRGRDAVRLLEMRWRDFVVPGLGVRCVDTNPWVTAAESAELVMALDAIGERERALAVLRDIAHLRAPDGGYWTGYVYTDEAIWPQERTTYTGAAVILAVDALSQTTPGADIVRGATLPVEPADAELACSCTERDREAVA